MYDPLSNSLKSQEAKKVMPERIEQGIELADTKKNESFMTKVASSFVNAEPSVVGKSLLMNVIIPNAKRTIIVSVATGLSMMFNLNITPQMIDTIFGQQSSGSKIGYTMPYTNYGSYASYNQSMNPPQTPMVAPPSEPVSGITSYTTFQYKSKDDALHTIEYLAELADVYDRAVGVGYLCQRVGRPDTSDDYNFGWNKELIARAKPVLGMDGAWYISWPKPVPIKNI